MLFHNLEVFSLEVDPYILRLPVGIRRPSFLAGHMARFFVFFDLRRRALQVVFPRKPTENAHQEDKQDLWTLIFFREAKTKNHLSTHESDVMFLKLKCQDITFITFQMSPKIIFFTGEHMSHV